MFPNITNLSVENTTYSTGNVPLNFIVNENITQAAYSLDEQTNTTIAGNAKSAVVQQSQPYPVTTVLASFIVGGVLTFLFFFRKDKRLNAFKVKILIKLQRLLKQACWN
ncbi:MAG TPA: hypothetical protein VLU95_03670 [Candidatus Acidoferrum sp.]|nr:hypothetical protein [Candidatus Acidoferrum sp.]